MDEEPLQLDEQPSKDEELLLLDSRLVVQMDELLLKDEELLLLDSRLVVQMDELPSMDEEPLQLDEKQQPMVPRSDEEEQRLQFGSQNAAPDSRIDLLDTSGIDYP